MNQTTYWASVKASSQSDSGIIETYEPLPYITVGAIIKSNQTGVTTTVVLVLSSTVIQVASSIGFLADTTIQVTLTLFTGESLARLLPEVHATEDTNVFLNVPASEFQSCYEAISKIPEVKDTNKCPTSVLPHLAASYGVTFDPDLDEATKRELIRLSQYVYLKRGTRDGLVAVFNALGYEADVQELYTKAYTNEIANISSNTITLTVAGAQLPPAGTFSVKALLTKTNTMSWIRKINSAVEFEVEAGTESLFSIGDTVKIYEYSTTKDLTHAPYTSSFINIVYTDRKVPPRALDDSLLRILNSYLLEFKSSHARLWGGTGIERILRNLVSFKDDAELVERGLLCENVVPVFSIDILNTFDGTIPAAELDRGMGSTLDANLQLDDIVWLSAETFTDHNRVALSASDTINLSENWRVARR